jgi:hypothetical protein
MILHVGFFGRLIALYRRNYDRVACLTTLGEELNEQKLDSWWNCRSVIFFLAPALPLHDFVPSPSFPCPQEFRLE